MMMVVVVGWGGGQKRFPRQFLSVPTRVSIGRCEEAGQLIICHSPCPPNPDCQSSTTGTRATKKQNEEVRKETDSPIKCDPGETKWNYSSHTAKKKEEEKEKEQQEQKPMKGGEPIIHCDRTSPLRLRLNPHRTAQRRQKKYKSTSRKNVLPRTWSRKKTKKRESNTINSSLFRTFSPTKMFFSFIDRKLYQECAT